MREHRISLYGVIVSLVTSLGAALFVLLAVAAMTRQARQEQREIACDVARTQTGVYASAAPQTDTGKAARDAWQRAESRWCR